MVAKDRSGLGNLLICRFECFSQPEKLNFVYVNFTLNASTTHIDFTLLTLLNILLLNVAFKAVSILKRLIFE